MSRLVAGNDLRRHRQLLFQRKLQQSRTTGRVCTTDVEEFVVIRVRAEGHVIRCAGRLRVRAAQRYNACDGGRATQLELGGVARRGRAEQLVAAHKRIEALSLHARGKAKHQRRLQCIIACRQHACSCPWRAAGVQRGDLNGAASDATVANVLEAGQRRGQDAPCQPGLNAGMQLHRCKELSDIVHVVRATDACRPAARRRPCRTAAAPATRTAGRMPRSRTAHTECHKHCRQATSTVLISVFLTSWTSVDLSSFGCMAVSGWGIAVYAPDARRETLWAQRSAAPWTSPACQPSHAAQRTRRNGRVHHAVGKLQFLLAVDLRKQQIPSVRVS